MPDIAEIMNSQIFGMPVVFLIGIALFVVFIIFILKVAKGKQDDRPPIIDPEIEIQKEFNDVIKDRGEKITYKTFLQWGMIRLGRIVSVTPFKYEETIDLKKLARSNKTLEQLRTIVLTRETIADKNETIVSKDVKDDISKFYSSENFILFAICGKTIVHYIFYSLGFSKPKYYLVDKKFLDSNKSQDVFIDLDAMPMQFYKNIYIFSMEGKKVIQGMVNHLTIKTLMKENVNFIPQMHYFDYKTGRFVAKADAIRTQKKKAWKDKEQSLEEEIKDADDDE